MKEFFRFLGILLFSIFGIVAFIAIFWIASFLMDEATGGDPFYGKPPVSQTTKIFE